jgi:outer membrane protein
MWRLAVCFSILVCTCGAEVRTLSLREAVQLALNQNPDLLLARLDEIKATEAVRLARDPFIPKVVVGSGLAYTSGFPMSIEGATPSIMQARAIADVFNRPQSFRVASAKETRRAATFDLAGRQDEAIYRTAELFLEAQKAGQMAEVSRGEVKALESVWESVKARVAEGRDLPIEARKAELALARARYRMQIFESNVSTAQTALAGALGFDAGDRAQPTQGDNALPALPASAGAAAQVALKNSKELRMLESRLVAKGFDVRAERAAKWPKLDLVAQYGLLAEFNNYGKFFNAFQRHNGQLGISFQVPVWTGPGADAAAAQAEAEAAQLRIQIRTARRRIDADARSAYDNVAQMETARDIARMDLDIAREEVSVLLAQSQEGRASLRQLEGARSSETGKWVAFYDAASNVERARLNLLRQVGGLTAALQ